MFYATIDNGENYTFRFYTKADRDAFISATHQARALTAKADKFVPGTSKCVTYVRSTKTSNGFAPL